MFNEDEFLYLYGHIIMSYTSNFKGLQNLYAQKQISAEEFANLQIKNFETYERKRKKFFYKQFGKHWKERLQQLDPEKYRGFL